MPATTRRRKISRRKGKEALVAVLALGFRSGFRPASPNKAQYVNCVRWVRRFSAMAITISDFQEKSQTGGLQPLIAVLRLFFSSGIPVRP
jgi:hypothetical protein